MEARKGIAEILGIATPNNDDMESRMSKAPTYLTPQQVYQLNEKHGWFQHGDAQSDVSKAFAQDAIEMHERMRAAAPDMLAALRAVIVDDENGQGLTVAVFKQVIDAISKAMNAPVKEPA